ncbi:cold shock and DUF1294 domain-containing protein [Candidatus Chloroploca sp. M-50]|uniref:Cold shock and DUF1294 domain-containing protein n=1 Tax=Candidatus Chloroploca mongolica TaxID=2528176 RepID=A0ABS4DH74_9CHLR|nr:cold shock and DUF1294 domain-containing protein [Candidatus Chloroploca mongolica]MBP1468749.1 cold shock and DUF1294 domain-containing protein [Candidatus Chloroploca mongolica]
MPRSASVPRSPELPLARRQRGVIRTWKAAQGYGFLAPEEGGEEIFVHITAVVAGRHRLGPGTVVTYALDRDAQQRPRAVNVRVGPGLGTPLRLALLASSLFLLAVGVISWLGFLPAWIVLAYLLLSACSALVYRFDKIQATQGQRRVPEATLHLLDALGGWPGALIAQWALPHKTRKAAYQFTFWLLVGLHLLGLAGVVWVLGRF